MDSAWSKSGYRGWVQGYRLVLQTLLLPAPIPLFATWQPNNLYEEHLALEALQAGQLPVTSLLLGDSSFGSPVMAAAYAQRGGWLLTPKQLPLVYRTWKHDLFALRKETIELLFQRIMQAVDLKDCPTKGLRRNGAFVGIDFTKRDVKPLQSIRDQLDEHIGGNIKSIRKLLEKKEIVAESDNLDHSSSERLIDSKAALLIKPAPRGNSKAGAEETTDGQEHSTPLGSVKFRRGNFGREGPIYAAEQCGRTTFVDLNIDHPFYERFVLANRDNRDAFNAVDEMIYSMAAAELKVFDEDNREFVESWKAVFSSNLRTLLS
ncbi:MAG: hypothetical protein WKF84_02770 [Pyrinomonadaceae bacterium]